jgi:hypothetical protein
MASVAPLDDVKIDLLNRQPSFPGGVEEFDVE